MPRSPFPHTPARTHTHTHAHEYTLWHYRPAFCQQIQKYEVIPLETKQTLKLSGPIYTQQGKEFVIKSTACG